MDAMSPRARIFMLVAGAAAIAAGIVVVGVLATRSDVPTVKPRPGSPPLALDLGARADPEAQALRNAETLYDRNRQAARAEAIFRRYDSLEAQVGEAIASWPSGTVGRLQELASRHPQSALVAFHLGLALYWARHDTEAVQAWRAAQRLDPDSLYAVRAADFLHPGFAPGLPTFVPSFQPPLRIRVLPPAQELDALARAARADGAHAKILYGVALQRLDRPRSAARQFAAAASQAPGDPEARTAAAVGRFDKANPSAAFSRLGPLVRVFPHAQTVRFHLGLLLIWIGQVNQARSELQRARREDPTSTLGQQAVAYLNVLAKAGTE
jgi:tetratricopeptide (TPR) repeat protein